MKFKQKVGPGIQATNSNWTFKGKVANTFDSHINKSVPFYRGVINLLIKLVIFL